MKKSNIKNNEIKRFNDGVYEVEKTNVQPQPERKHIITADNVKKFAKDSAYCAGVTFASSLLLSGGSMIFNKIREKRRIKKAASIIYDDQQTSEAKNNCEEIDLDVIHEGGSK